MVLAYCGLGSMVLGTEILVRFHAAIPDATETQFASGLGHLVEAAVGIAIPFPHLRRRSRRIWIVANVVAVTYWVAQILMLTPPWVAVPGPPEGVPPFPPGTPGFCALVHVVLWRAAPPAGWARRAPKRSARSPPRPP